VPAKVVVIGFDAAEATLVEPWAREGVLPAFGRLTEQGMLLRPETNVDTLPASAWAEIATGRMGGKIGWYWNRYQLHSGESALRQTRLGDVDLTAVWDIASAAGRRCAVLDVPHAAPAAGLNGIQLREFGNHDTAFDLGTEPPEFMDEVLERFGRYPGPRGDDCEEHETTADLERILDGIEQGVELKRELFRTLLEEGEWDLFFACFSESHCVSHQYWQYFDESSPWHEHDAPERFKRAIPTVYGRLDVALGEVIEAAGPDATILAVLSHGMGQSVGGPQVLPEVLVRLGYASGHGVTSTVRGRMPPGVKRALKFVLRGGARKRLQRAAGSLPRPLESPETRAIAVKNGRCGAIRLNLKGRDPFGAIEPGAEYDAACAELIEEISKLEHADTGAPAVREVVRTDTVYGPELHANIPDLVVRFDGSSGPIHAVRSSRVGTVSIPIEQHSLQRSGDHTPHSRIWIRGPGVAAGEARDEGHSLDIAPTVLSLLDVAIPSEFDGRPLDLGRTALV
jgi:predicted AlkP superfamily phosphohydrolase/phosphomutase